MNNASMQYNQFKEEIARDEKVFTFTKKGEYLVHTLGEREAIAFWSSRERMVKTQKAVAKYKAYTIEELTLDEFMEWLPELGREGIQIGTNWTGKPPEGYDVSVQDLLAGLNQQVKR